MIFEENETVSETVAIKAREVKTWYVFVPSKGKYLVSDPDLENPVLHREFYSAFEFGSFEHAIRARDTLSIAGFDSHIFGDIYEV